MTQTEELLRLSITYRRLIDDMEALVVGDWSESEKLKLLWLLDETVGQVVKETVEEFTQRCPSCDSENTTIVCDDCGDWTSCTPT